MIITTQVRQWQSFYGLVMRTKKPHYIYRNGEWFGYSCDTKPAKKIFNWPVNDFPTARDVNNGLNEKINPLIDWGFNNEQST